MTRPLRIWLPAIRAGSGADVFVLRLAQALERAGHEPQVDWFDHRYELMPWRLMSFAAPAGTDVIHANSWQGFAFKRPNVPLVITEHQYVPHPGFAPYQHPLQRYYHRWFVEACMRRSFGVTAATVAVSEYIAAAMRSDLDKPIEVIPNWVDTRLFSPAAGAAGRSSSGGVTKLLFVGNPSRRKGADLLQPLAGMLGSNFEVHCLGGLREGFDAKRLLPNIKLLPRVEPNAMPDVYRSMDIALVPTRYEPFGYVALEAMACGLPVLGFDSSGTAEVCIHGETALLAPVDDLDRLIFYARDLAEDIVLRERLGLAGRRRAVEFFGEDKAVSAYINVYRHVLRGSAFHF